MEFANGGQTDRRRHARTQVQDEAPVDLIEISGVIKWFDVAKGYGFIVPDNGMPDVLLHVTCLRRDGFQTAYEGARVVVRGAGPAEGPAGVSRRLHGRDDGDASCADAAHAAALGRDADEPAGQRHRQMVQPHARLWLRHGRRGDAGHLRPHGDAAALRDDGAAGPGRSCWCATAKGTKGRTAAEIRPHSGGQLPASH